MRRTPNRIETLAALAGRRYASDLRHEAEELRRRVAKLCAEAYRAGARTASRRQRRQATAGTS